MSGVGAGEVKDDMALARSRILAGTILGDRHLPQNLGLFLMFSLIIGTLFSIWGLARLCGDFNRRLSELIPVKFSSGTPATSL